MLIVIILILVFVILAARSKLVAGGSVHLVINEDKEFDVPTGGKLMNALADLGIFVPSACGGGGTCGPRCQLPVDSVNPQTCCRTKDTKAGTSLGLATPSSSQTARAVSSWSASALCPSASAVAGS